MNQTNAFSAVRGGDALFPNDFGEDLFYMHSIQSDVGGMNIEQARNLHSLVSSFACK